MLEDDDYVTVIKAGYAICTQQKTGRVLTFKRIHNLYRLVKAEIGPVCENENTLCNEFEYSYAVADVKDPSQWSKKQIARALRARDMHIRAGHPGRSEETKRLHAGGYKGFEDITVADLALADKILYECQLCIKSKAIRPFKLPARIPTSVIGMIQHVDYFFLATETGTRVFVIFVD